jgi:hypothetical protein
MAAPNAPGGPGGAGGATGARAPAAQLRVLHVAAHGDGVRAAAADEPRGFRAVFLSALSQWVEASYGPVLSPKHRVLEVRRAKPCGGLLGFSDA